MPTVDYSISIGQIVAVIVFVAGAFAQYTLLREAVRRQEERINAIEERMVQKLDEYEKLFRELYAKVGPTDQRP